MGESTNYVFTTETGGPCDPRKRAAGLARWPRRGRTFPCVGLHTLRHSAATVMLEKGVPLKVVSEILGHFSVSITGESIPQRRPDVSAQAMDVLGVALDAR